MTDIEFLSRPARRQRSDGPGVLPQRARFVDRILSFMKFSVPWRRIAGAFLLWGVAAMAPPSIASHAVLLDYTPDEVRRILQHGPWPPPPARDAGNARASDP